MYAANYLHSIVTEHELEPVDDLVWGAVRIDQAVPLGVAEKMLAFGAGTTAWRPSKFQVWKKKNEVAGGAGPTRSSSKYFTC